MRQFVAVLCVLIVGKSAALAQIAPANETASQPIVDLSPVGPNADSFFYAEAELLLRWFKPVCASVPVVTIGNPQAAVPGAVGQPGTAVVIGGVPPHKFEFPMTPGVQFTLGWNRGDGTIGFEASGFIMERASNSQQFTADANGFPNTYLPYQAPDNSFQALPFTIPGVVTGGSEAVGSTKLWGVESNLTAPFAIDRGTYVFYGTFLLGGRYLDLADRVRITNTLSLVGNPSAFAIGQDQFSTHNQFAGPQVGTTMGLNKGPWSMELTTKFAAGITHQLRNIEGAPVVAASVASPLLVPGPLLALPSNISRQTARRVTLVPEIAVKTQFALTEWCSVSGGYSLLYWNKVLCPGDQMSPLVNVTQLPGRGPVTGPLDPKPQFLHTDYFAQGLNAGVEFRY